MEYNLDFLENIYSILNKYKEKENKSGNNISILKISGKDHDEVVICRLIAFLLNPKENHNQDVKFLNLFLDEIGETIQQNENFDVITEFPTDQGRRIDIVLKSNKRFIPIEVKIYASDQKEQCVHYYNYSHSNYNAEKVFYLTPYEHTPDESSKGDLKPGETLKLITFKEQILNWLENCEKDNSNYTPMLLELIRELKIAIRKFCGLVENKEMNEELLKEIMKSENNLEVAKAICSAEKSINPNDLWKNFCNNIEQNTIGDWHEYAKNEENTLTVYVEEIDVDFTELFNSIFITSTADISKTRRQEIFEKLRNILINENFNCGEIDIERGFNVSNTKEFFLRNGTESQFDLYFLFIYKKEQIIERIKAFISLINEIYN